MIANVLALGEEADFEELNCLLALNPLFCQMPVSGSLLFIFLFVRE
jgi:hypothetical protein